MRAREYTGGIEIQVVYRDEHYVRLSTALCPGILRDVLETHVFEPRLVFTERPEIGTGIGNAASRGNERQSQKKRGYTEELE